MTAMLGLREAADRCGVSVNTIRKRQRDGRLPNAIVDEQGWRIPITDLIADGLEPVSPRLAEQRALAEARFPGPSPRPGEPTAVDDELRRHIATLERLVAAQELHIADLRRRIEEAS